MKTQLDSALRQFFAFCRERRIDKAILLGIPYAGRSLDELIYGGNVENLIRHVHEETVTNQAEILRAITDLMRSHEQVQAAVHVFGNANAELIIQPADDMIFGAKNDASGRASFGGGGLNYSMRLISMGIATLPFLSVGNDNIGKTIQEWLCNTIRTKTISPSIVSFVEDRDFCVPNARTSHATIIVQRAQRTILSQRAKEGHYYRRHLPNRLKSADDLGLSEASGVIIGHLSCDACDGNICGDIDCTASIIQRYAEKCPILMNFGHSQLTRGYSYWSDKINRHCILQFNLAEAKMFFRDELPDDAVWSILDFLRDKEISAIVTLDRFGAVANFRDGRNGVILAWPLLDRTQIIDPTGAGDAFAAGVMASLKGRRGITFADFFAAVEEGRNWAAYCCRTYGGADECPDAGALARFLSDFDFRGWRLVEFLNRGSAEQIVRVIDMAYR
jgi:sugar/nucleoside kinase (ribokinase family)